MVLVLGVMGLVVGCIVGIGRGFVREGEGKAWTSQWLGDRMACLSYPFYSEVQILDGG